MLSSADRSELLALRFLEDFEFPEDFSFCLLRLAGVRLQGIVGVCICSGVVLSELGTDDKEEEVSDVTESLGGGVTLRDDPEFDGEDDGGCDDSELDAFAARRVVI